MATATRITPPDGAASVPAPEKGFPVLALALCGGVWVALTGADPGAAVVGVPVVLATAFAARAAGSRRYFPRLLQAPAFLLWFLREIFASAWDLAARLLSRDPQIAPVVVPYSLRLRGEGARAAFMNAVTLTPGTLSAGLVENRLEVHALTGDAGLAESLAEMEARVARLFGETLAEPGP
jgi:multicomponent Na+:H+ antiporter subunit E